MVRLSKRSAQSSIGPGPALGSVVCAGIFWVQFRELVTDIMPEKLFIWTSSPVTMRAGLVIRLAQRYEIVTNEPTRDLIVQQFDGNAFFINGFLQAASERKTALTSFLNCQRLYV